MHRWILAVASRLVPKPMREEWRAEWDAELFHHASTRRPWSARGFGLRLDLLRRTTGAFWDALWLQSSHWYSLRLFGRHWRMALAAVLSLSTAIAATTIGFAAYNALLLRPPGVRDPGSLVLIHAHTADDPFGAMSYPEYRDYRERAHAFSEITAFPYTISRITLSRATRSEQVLVTQVSPDFFHVLGIAPRLGGLTMQTAPERELDDIVVSEAFWKTLGAEPQIIGSTVKLNDQTVRIAGVVPATFGGMTLVWEPDVWIPLTTAEKVLGSSPALLKERTERWLRPVGRLKHGVTRAQALADVQLVAAQIARDRPATDAARSAVITPVMVTPPEDRGWMSLMLGALLVVVLLTLMIACVNVTNLLLGLAASRRHEMLVRAALGASRLQIVAPMLRESVTLSLVSCAIGYGAAAIFLAKLAAFRPSLGGFWPAPSLNFHPDTIVMAAVALLAVVAGLGVGVAPAWRAASDGLSGSIHRELTTSEPRKGRIRQILVLVQMAVATLVLVGVGISVRSLVSLRDAPLGFSARHLAFIGFDLLRSGYDEARGPAEAERLRQAIAALPNVAAVSLADDPPMAGFNRDRVLVEGAPPPADGHGLETPYSVVDDHYFSTIGLRVLAGRTFTAADTRRSPEVIVVNETLARRDWPGQNPIGRRLRIENGNRLVEVIGVVPDAKYEDISEPQLPFMYFALTQHYLPQVSVIARPAGDARLAPNRLMEAMLDLNPGLVPGGFGGMTLDDLVELSLLLPRAIVMTNLFFAAVSLALAVFGLYSTVFYAVSQRTKEMGIRTALGALPRDLFALVLWQTGWVAGTGAVLGLASGAALLPVVASLFYGIKTAEPAILVSVGLVSMLLAVATTYAASRRWIGLSSVEMLRR